MPFRKEDVKIPFEIWNAVSKFITENEHWINNNPTYLGFGTLKDALEFIRTGKLVKKLEKLSKKEGG